MMGIGVNYLAVLVAAVASFLFGWLWHGMLFQKQWMKLSGLTFKSMKKMHLSPLASMSLGFVIQLVMTYVLAVFISAFSISSLYAGVQLAFWLWLGFVMPLTAGVWVWEGKPFMLFILNTAYWLLAMFIMVSVLTFF